MKKGHLYLVFILDEQQYAVPVGQVDRVVRAVEVTPIADSPEVIAGIINLGGIIVPVINLRRQLHLVERAIDINDQFVIAKTRKLTVALVVDEVEGVIGAQELEMTEAADVFPGLGFLQGVVKMAGKMLLIQDLEAIVSKDLHKSLTDIVSSTEEGRQ